MRVELPQRIVDSICATRRHCEPCRATATGARFRERLGTPDVCPHGIADDCGPQASTVPEPTPRTPEQIAAAKEARERAAEELKIKGRAAWDALHRARGWTLNDVMDWIDRDVPAYGCQCRQEARGAVLLHHPPKGDDDAFFAWTVEFHNSVNRKLGKPEMRLDAARAMYGRETQTQ